MNIFKLSLLNCAVSLALLSAGAQAATVDVSKLGTELTPFGAEKAGNADGSIPAWTGGLTKAPEGWAPGHGVWGAMEPKTNVSSESHRKGAFRSPAHPPGITL